MDKGYSLSPEFTPTLDIGLPSATMMPLHASAFHSFKNAEIAGASFIEFLKPRKSKECNTGDRTLGCIILNESYITWTPLTY